MEKKNRLIDYALIGLGSVGIMAPILCLINFYLFKNQLRLEKPKAVTGKTFQTMNDKFFQRCPTEHQLAFLLQDVSFSLQLLHYNDRPDSTESGKDIAVALLGTKDVFRGKEGDIFYLGLQGGHVVKVDRASPYWVQFFCMPSGDVQGVFHIELFDLAGDLVYHAEEIVTIKKTNRIEQKSQDREFLKLVSALQKSQFLGPDRLMMHYGGARYRTQGDRTRLYVGNDLLFLNSFDKCVFRDGHWLICGSDEETSGLPLMQVEVCTHDFLRCVVWDAFGQHSEVVEFSYQEPSLEPFSDFSEGYLRTHNSAVCQLANKSTLVKKGDWLVKKNGAWRVLDSLDEVNGVLIYKEMSELLIVDEIKEENGQAAIYGHRLDPLHQRLDPIELVLKGKGDANNSIIKQKKKRAHGTMSAKERAKRI